MMNIRLHSFTIRSFRGIPDELHVDLGEGLSLLVLGPNGTGKSTIADALQFYFKGRIDFLNREGRHILHHLGGDEEKAEVSVTASRAVTGTASVSSPAQTALAIARSETFLLRGRTLSEFVDARKNEKWQTLFDILGLTPVEQFRKDLQQVRNPFQGEAEAAQTRLRASEGALRTMCHEPSERSLLAKLVEVSKAAGLTPPASLTEALAPKWITGLAGRDANLQRAATIRNLSNRARGLPALPGLAPLVAAARTVANMHGDVNRLSLVRSGLRIFDSDSSLVQCPLCQQAVERSTIYRALTESLAEMDQYSGAVEAHRRALRQFATKVQTSWDLRQQIRKEAGALGVDIEPVPDSPVPLIDGALEVHGSNVPGEVTTSFAKAASWDRTAVQHLTSAAPTLTGGDEALATLLQLIDQGRDWLRSSQESNRLQSVAARADRLLQAYVQAQGAHVQRVLDRISERLAAIYGRLHSAEGYGKVGLERSSEKGIELSLEFNGELMQPPHAVISESHLHSLGLAIFLAMADTFNRQLGFIVLDDVVNSFDVSHRGALAELIAEEYADRQVIVLTHDPLFYGRLSKLMPKARKLELTSWTFDEGPRFTRYELGHTRARALSKR